MAETLELAKRVTRRSLMIWTDVFECPFCGKTWERGGHKEGFVKSAAQTHVGGCRDIALWNLGYVGTVESDLETIENAKSKPYYSRWRRNTLALIRDRKKAGRKVTVPHG